MWLLIGNLECSDEAYLTDIFIGVADKYNEACRMRNELQRAETLDEIASILAINTGSLPYLVEKRLAENPESTEGIKVTIKSIPEI